MKLYLASCDLGNKEKELKNWIQENGNKIVLIPNALDYMENDLEKQYSIDYDVSMLEDVGFDVKVACLKEYFGNYNQLKTDFESYRAFFAIGGNVFVLRKAMALSGFDQYINNFSDKEDYLYGGYSAGICVLTQNLEVYKQIDQPFNPYNNEEIIYNGLGVVDYIPIPHFGNFYMNHLADKCNKQGKKLKILRDGEAMIETTHSLELDIER